MAVTHLEVVVEERSMEKALEILLPQIVPGTGFDIHPLEGKVDLMAKLPGLLRGYSHWPDQAGLGVVVVVDRDDDECHRLVDRLDAAAGAAGFVPVSVRGNTAGTIVNRLAIEELEAWWFGASDAVRTAYPRVRGTERWFRDSDAVVGGTWEALERVLQKAGHHRGGLRKLAAAEDIARHVDVETNASPSFQRFRDGVRLLVNGVT